MDFSEFITTPISACKNQLLTKQGSWPDGAHVWDAPEMDAIALALASGRPLLIRGEPGTGKSQIARAAAARLKWQFLYEVISARHEAQDLLWHYDAVERLAIANKAQRTQMQDFVLPGILWQALHPSSAATQSQRVRDFANGKQAEVSLAQSLPTPSGSVVLLDEIDKADGDLHNGLLEVLANRSFSLPWGAPLHAPEETAPPSLIILTSNEERELPPAFVRRCICLHLVPPKDSDQAAFCAWLLARAEAHFPEMDEGVLREGARQVYQDRLAASLGMGARAGLAEYLDLLRALHSIAPDAPAKQLQWLARLKPYALKKQYPQAQHDGALPPDPREDKG